MRTGDAGQWGARLAGSPRPARGGRRGLHLTVAAAVIGLVLVVVGAPAPAGARVVPAPASPAVAPRGAAAATTTTVGTTSVVAPLFHPSGAIVTGSDGNLWFTASAKTIGRSTPTGVITTFPVPQLGSVGDMALGPDGAVWFTNLITAGSSIGRITTAGAVSFFPLPGITPGAAIVAGGDGNLWFTTSTATVGRMTTAGVVTTFPTPAILSSLAAGPGTSLWFAPKSLGPLGTIAADGTVTTFTTQVAYASVMKGPDGNLWFADSPVGGARIGRVTPEGVFTAFTSPSLSNPTDLTVGPDGFLWFRAGYTDIGKISMDGAITVFHPTGIGPQGLTAGPDGKVWFSNGNSVARITVNGFFVDRYYGTGLANPTSMTRTADGDAWVTNDGNHTITRVRATGVQTAYTNARIGTLLSITTGDDGNLWFTNGNDSSIGRLTPSGTFTFFTDAMFKDARSILSASDGTLWFTAGNGSTIVKMSLAGDATAFAVPQFQKAVHLAMGPDGNVWFVGGTGTVGRMTPAGAFTFLPGPGAGYVDVLTTGPDGFLWFVRSGSGGIGRISMTGEISEVTVTEPHRIYEISSIETGPDGNLWLTGPYFSEVLRITPGGVVTQFPGIQGPKLMTAGPDGDLWFMGNDAIMRITAVDPPGLRGLRFHPQAPVRLLDSRGDTGGWHSPLVAGAPRTLTVAGGASGIPAGAGAVVLNVTATGATANSFLTVHPAGGAPPTTSNLNFAVGQTIPNLVTVRVGSGGNVALENAVGAVDVVVDAVGYYDDAASDRFTAIYPQRVLDSRIETGGWNGPLQAGTPRSLAVRGVGGVPQTADAVVVNVTATAATAGSFLTVFPSGDATVPVASNLNFAAGETIPNLVTVKVGTDGGIAFANAVGDVHVVADVVGFYDPTQGDVFRAVDPQRVLDSRGAVGGWTGPLFSGLPQTLGVVGLAGLADDVTSVVGNVTVTGATAPSFVTVFPAGTPQPVTSNLNFAAGQTIPNLVVVDVGQGGGIAFKGAAGSTDVLFDLVGFFAPS